MSLNEFLPSLPFPVVFNRSVYHSQQSLLVKFTAGKRKTGLTVTDRGGSVL